MKIESSGNGEIILSFTDIGISCPSRDFLYAANMSFNAIRENKILAKISGQYLRFIHVERCNSRSAEEASWSESILLSTHCVIQLQ